jgi:hypothetical protein
LITTDRGAADHPATPHLQPPFVSFIPLFDSASDLLLTLATFLQQQPTA